ncbi:DUF4097 family beta strand repeat-containing protein [Heyndrickxia sp. NPDC080065]|uniref:DUF4097 family beta strand repeat-containing protein n=1 Tax=Heyndrickxia sp. NPDC080065 TaxID=3390568 RepID=UPI003CFD570F
MQEERKRIIDLVRDGKLSTDEALILLDALEKKQESKDEKVLEEVVSDSEQKQDQSGKENNEDRFSSQFSDARDKIMDFVNSAFKKIKDIDLQFNQSVEFPHVFQQANVNLTNIDIDIANGQVEVKAWDHPDIRVECQAKVYRKDNRDEARTFFIENSSFYIDNGLLRFSTQSKWMKVDTVVYVPKTEYEKVSFRTFNGGVKGEGLKVDDLRTKTANGKIMLKNVDTEKIDAETVNGRIIVQESQANRLTAESMHGSITVEGKYHTIDLQTLNGNLSCALHNQETDTLHLKAVSGNINVYVPSDISIEGECKSNLGNIKVALEDIDKIEEKKEVVQKQIRFKRKGISESPLHIFADTKTGSIFVQTNEMFHSEENKE